MAEDTRKSGNRGFIKAADFFAAGGTIGKGAPDTKKFVEEHSIEEGKQLATEIVSELQSQLKEGGVDPSSPQYAGLFEGAEAELDKQLAKKKDSLSMHQAMVLTTLRSEIAEVVKKNKELEKKAAKEEKQKKTASGPTVSPAATTVAPTATPDGDKETPEQKGAAMSAIRHELRHGEKEYKPEFDPKEVGQAMTKIRQELRHGNQGKNPQELEEKNLKTKGKLLELEEKQRKLFASNMKDMDVKSKIMFERSNHALEQLNKLSTQSEENLKNMGDSSKKVLEQIRDLLKMSRTASTAELSDIMKKLAALKAGGMEEASLRGDTAGVRGISEAADVARGSLGKAPQPGLASKLSSYYGGEIKEAARSIYENVVPKGVRIIAEHVGGKLFNSQRKQENRAAVEAKMQAQQNVLDSMRDTSDEDESPSRKRAKGMRIVSGFGAAASMGAMGGAKEVKLETLQIEKLIVKESIMGSGQAAEDSKLQGESDKHNTIRGGKGGKEGGIMGLIEGLFGKIMGPIKALFGPLMSLLAPLGGILSGLGGILMKALPALGVAAAGLVGYQVGKHVINPMLNKAAEAITGTKGETVGTALYSGVDKLQEKAGGLLGQSDAMKEKASSTAAAKTLYEKHLAEQGGVVTPAQAAFAKSQGVQVDPSKISENPITTTSSPTTADLNKAEAARMSAARTPNSGRITPPAGVSAPTDAIATRTNAVDNVSRTNESTASARSAKPIVVVNNTSTGGGKSQSPALPIGMGSARAQENAFHRYLLSVFAPM